MIGGRGHPWTWLEFYREFVNGCSIRVPVRFGAGLTPMFEVRWTADHGGGLSSATLRESSFYTDLVSGVSHTHSERAVLTCRVNKRYASGV